MHDPAEIDREREPATSSPILAVTGGIHFDLVVRLPRLPKPNDRIAVQEAVLAPGGMGGNVAVAFARLGGRVRFLGTFANDDDARALREDLQAEGIDVYGSSASPAEGTRRGFVLVGETGERAIIGRLPEADNIPRSSSSSARFIQVQATSPRQRQQSHIHQGPLPDGLLASPLAGFYCPSAFAPGIIPRLPDHIPLFIDIETNHLDHLEPDDITAILKRSSIIFGNIENLAGLLSRLAIPKLDDLAALTQRTIAATMGDEGCRVYWSDQNELVPPFPVNAVDTTGAGDCFAAAFILATLEGATPPHAARFANAAAAISTTQLGARTGVPTRASLMERAGIHY